MVEALEGVMEEEEEVVMVVAEEAEALAEDVGAEEVSRKAHLPKFVVRL